ncbi:hypothetical protein V9T40_002960 [Parthenolecanium corni]|uniref:Uncharacterized protein n=1 Tax=Parthenolecanium corni TaxID=536013 RepID=A0AAN9Y8F7_9HEMI
MRASEMHSHHGDRQRENRVVGVVVNKVKGSYYTPGVSPTGAEENESSEKGALITSNSNIDSSSSESIDGVDVHHKFPQTNHTIMPQHFDSREWHFACVKEMQA